MEQLDRFFSTLRGQGRVLYIPRRVWKAYQDGVVLRKPLYGKGNTPLVLSAPTFTNAREWQATLSTINFHRRRNYSILTHEEWVFRVQYCTYGCIVPLSMVPTTKRRLEYDEQTGREQWSVIGMTEEERQRRSLVYYEAIENESMFSPEQFGKARQNLYKLLQENSAKVAEIVDQLGLLR